MGTAIHWKHQASPILSEEILGSCQKKFDKIKCKAQILASMLAISAPLSEGLPPPLGEFWHWPRL